MMAAALDVAIATEHGNCASIRQVKVAENSSSSSTSSGGGGGSGSGGGGVGDGVGGGGGGGIRVAYR